MRPSEPLLRVAGAIVLLLAGLAYLAYKVEYLAMEGVETWLQVFIVLPGVTMLAAAGFVAFPDTRRRVGSCLLALGVVAMLACAMEHRAADGWTFYTPYSSLLGGNLRPMPALVGFATLAIGVAPFALGRPYVGARPVEPGLLLTLRATLGAAHGRHGL